MVRRLGLALTLLLAISSIGYADAPRYFKLTIVHTNDMHTHLLPFSYASNTKMSQKVKDSLPAIDDVGGAARRAAVIAKIRKETHTPLLLTDSGDTIIASGKDDRLGNYYHGTPAIAVMNAMGYDVMEPGNHEFQWGFAEPMRAEKQSNFPWICANLSYRKDDKLVFKPYIIRELWGVKVALLGLIQPMTARYIGAKELNVLDPYAEAAKWVPELRKQADLVIVLSHLGRGEDAKLAKAVPGIDAIIGGHSHSRIPTPDMATYGEAGAFDLNATPIVQAFQWGSELGRSDFIFRRDESGRYRLMSAKEHLIPLTSESPEDPAIAEMLKAYENAIPAGK